MPRPLRSLLLGPVLAVVGLLALVPLWRASTPSYSMDGGSLAAALQDPGLSVDPGLTVEVTTTLPTTTTVTVPATTSTTAVAVAGTGNSRGDSGTDDLARTGPAPLTTALAVLGVLLLGGGIVLVGHARTEYAALLRPAWRHLGSRRA